MEETIKSNPLWSNMKHDAVERKSRDLVLDWFTKHCDGQRVLDCCCGNGEDSILLGQNGAAEVTGIDASAISVANCQALARRNGLDNVNFKVADAENTGFDDNTFDVITGCGSLRHLELPGAYAEMARILKPDGRIICNEALAPNPIIHHDRRKTSRLRTPGEADHILRRKDFEVARQFFGKVELHFFHLFTLGAVPFRNTFLFKPLLALLEAVDAVVLKIPGIQWQARQVVFMLSEPRKSLRQSSRQNQPIRRAA